MTIDKGIQIKNVYYMLAYAYRCLFLEGYKQVEIEPFENVEDLLASILIRGTNLQIKRGLSRDYVSTQESRKSIRGKIILLQSALERALKKGTITCCFDDLSIDNRINQILKVTFLYLAKSPRVKKENKASIHKILIYFQDVKTISLSEINWSVISVNRNNENCLMLLNISRLILEGYLPTTQNGKKKLWQFSEKEMEMLYQHFILEYYRYHHKNYLSANPEAIDWDLSEAPSLDSLDLLPKMQTDITLRSKETGKKLIIDAKYYGDMLSENYGRKKIISNHLYQIFSYVKNLDKTDSGDTSGMLLYAETAPNGPIEAKYKIGKNQISVKSLNLNASFPEIADALNRIAQECFGPHEILHKITPMGL